MEDMDEAEFLLISDDEADDSFVLGDRRDDEAIDRRTRRRCGKADEDQRLSERPLIAMSGHSAVVFRPQLGTPVSNCGQLC